MRLSPHENKAETRSRPGRFDGDPHSDFRLQLKRGDLTRCKECFQGLLFRRLSCYYSNRLSCSAPHFKQSDCNGRHDA